MSRHRISAVVNVMSLTVLHVHARVSSQPGRNKRSSVAIPRGRHQRKHKKVKLTCLSTWIRNNRLLGVRLDVCAGCSKHWDDFDSLVARSVRFGSFGLVRTSSGREDGPSHLPLVIEQAIVGSKSRHKKLESDECRIQSQVHHLSHTQVVLNARIACQGHRHDTSQPWLQRYDHITSVPSRHPLCLVHGHACCTNSCRAPWAR